MRIGPYELHAVDTGRFALDGGAMFGVVPKTLWQRTNPPDEKNRIPMAARALLLRGGGRTILIDTGNGVKFDEKLASIYNISLDSHVLLDSLAKLGIRPEDVTDVILTHLHFDHAGGSTVIRDGMAMPTFPRAAYHIQREQWEAALHPTERDRASYFPENYLPLQAHGLVKFAEGDGELLPGVRVLAQHGHTAALQCPLISDGKTTLLYAADLVPTASHVPLPWIMAYDLRPLSTLEEKRKLLGRAAEEGWIVFFEHDPGVAAGMIQRTDKGLTLRERIDVDR
jgi:glyoxylase-like metal-dependent hydrolase (beta-lactamase superfamily II)